MHQTKLLIVCVVLLTLVAYLVQTSVEAQERPTISFNRDIRPIFSDTCFRCHGPDKAARQAGLRLDLREEAVKKTRSGVVPIVPGKPDQSEIIQRIFSSNAHEIMPPADAHKELTARQKETIRQWVAEGAQYEGHWAYQPVTRPSIPTIRNPQSAVRNPIDAFIQARLAKEGLQPAPEADRRTLIRRVALDLTGVPPTPQEVAAFVTDKSPDAYEKVVDRLLASDRYAEKQAIYWLDAVRYADTAGFHGDNAWPAWPFRDYVLRAFRDNKPFDEFTREQIAGDLLPSATTEQRIASAYTRLNRVSAEGGLQPKEYLAKYAADRVRTTAGVWMAATLGCAECHDHKFDPFLAKDFYAMEAFFADIKETGLVPDRGRNGFGSKLELPTEEQKRRIAELTRRIGYTRTELDTRAQALLARSPDWEQRVLGDYEAGRLAWQIQHPLTAKSQQGTTVRIYNDESLTVTQYRGGSLITEEIKGDGLVVASGANPEREIYTITFRPGAGQWTALGLDVVQDESLPGNRLARGADRFVLSEVEAEVASGAGNAAKLEFALATTDGAGQPLENSASLAIDGDPNTGWGVQYADGRDMFLALRLRQPLKTDAASTITVRLRHESEIRNAVIGRFRLALSSATYAWPDHLIKTPRPLRGLPLDVWTVLQPLPQNAAPAAADPAKRAEARKKAWFDYFKWSRAELQPLNEQLARLEAERDLLDAQVTRVLVAESGIPRTVRVLARGNFMDESGAIVEPAVPVMFGNLDVGERRATRLDLANWLVSPENPLTARVFVNRTWRQFFGTGLSKVLDDLGSQGEWPTHPELLDWLASEFMHPMEKSGVWRPASGVRSSQQPIAHDWDVKHIIRLIVTSHTYRQASTLVPRLQTPDSRLQTPSDDPENRLLSRQNRYRVDAEVVRDIALSVSGLLVEKFGGPSVKPYQPEGYLGALNFPKRDYAADRGEALYRRGLYVHWQRTFLHPSLLAFDAPSREECTVNRVSSNTPLQSLVLLNDPIFVEAARVFAQNALGQGGATPAAQIGWAFTRALGRSATTDELKILVDLHRKSLTRFTSDATAARELIETGDAPLPKPVSPARLAAMTTVTRAILNLHETITRN